jgi:TPR repeat protein
MISKKDYLAMRIQANQLSAQELTVLRDKALANDVRAAETLGMAYQLGCPGSPWNVKEALRWYHLAADMGSSIAANQIGVYFDPEENFSGVRGRDAGEALKWYRKAAERGDDVVALYNVGEFLHEMNKDPEALGWYRRAMDKGDPVSATILAEFYRRGQALPGKSKNENWKEAVDLFQRSAGEGNAGSQFVMAQAYKQGWFGMDRNLQETVNLLRRSAEQGFPDAELAIAGLYFDGKLVSKDRAEAAKWFLRAADHEEPEAALTIALMYERGNGVTQDFPAAYMWYEFARIGGAREAQTPRTVIEAGNWVRLRHRYTAAEIDEAKKRMQAWFVAHGKAHY